MLTKPPSLVQRKNKHDISSNARALRRLRTACERAKRTLSSATQASVEIDSLYEGDDFYTTITRARFEELCADLFRSTLKPVEQVLRDARIDKRSVDEVVLVGGSTRIPKIQSLVSNFFNGKEPCKSINPDEAVAYGAAVQGAILTGHGNETTDKILLVDVVPLSLGIETNGELMTTLIPRNTKIPVSKTESFSTASDNQPGVSIQIYEGERRFTRDNTLLGNFELTGIPPAPRGVPKINVTYSVDANGILSVSATDETSGNSKSITVKNERRLDARELDRMVKEAAEHEEADRASVERIEAKNRLENTAYSARNAVRASGDKNAEQVIEAALQWLEHNASASKEEFEHQRVELEKKLQSMQREQQSQPQPQPNPGRASNGGPVIQEVD